MKDTLGYPINVGDIVVQCANEWGLNAYRVDRDPADTKLVRVTNLWYKEYQTSIHKKSVNFLNLSAIFGDVLSEEEIKRRLTELHDA